MQNFGTIETFKCYPGLVQVEVLIKRNKLNELEGNVE